MLTQGQLVPHDWFERIAQFLKNHKFVIPAIFINTFMVINLIHGCTTSKYNAICGIVCLYNCTVIVNLMIVLAQKTDKDNWLIVQDGYIGPNLFWPKGQKKSLSIKLGWPLYTYQLYNLMLHQESHLFVKLTVSGGKQCSNNNLILTFDILLIYELQGLTD